MTKSLTRYLLIFLLIVPFFGFNFVISIIGNILLLVFLIPLLVFIIILISFNSLKSKVNTCNQCGAVSLGINNTCMNCGSNLDDTNSINSEAFNKPSETTIEVKAEEIK